MSGIALQIDIRDGAGPLLARLRASFAPRRIAAEMAQDFRDLTRSHLVALAGARHHSFAPKNFYGEASRATTATASADGVTISIRQQGIAQRYFGGHLEAKPGKALTIPANEDTYGRSAADFGNLRAVFFKGKNVGALIEKESSTIKITKKHGVQHTSSTIGRVMFWLVKSVDQAPDPTVLPNEAAYTGAARIGLTRMLASVKGGAA